MGSVLISVEEKLKRAALAFVEDSCSGNMDYMIHKFPAGLRDVGSRYIVPLVVAIGPYHRASNHLRNMEEVKRAAAYHFCRGENASPEQVYEHVLSVAGDARKLYVGDVAVGMGNLENFAETMFLDVCFLLYYMDAYQSFRDKHDFRVNTDLRSCLFTNRACINNDIMLLENQLPWLVLKKVIDSLSPDNNYYMDVVNKFIEDMGNTFRIDEKGKSALVSSNSNSPPPPHLLALLRRHKIERQTDLKWPHVDRMPATSVIELAEIGIKLKASTTAMFSDMNVKERGPFCGELSLAPLSLNDTRASWLVNMAAFEVSTTSTLWDDHPNQTAVCSYLALLGMFMLREEDVHQLRSKHILCGYQTNAEILSFGKVIGLFPEKGSRFAHVMVSIEHYKASRRMRTKVHQLVYRKFWTIIKMVTLIGTLVGIVQALMSVNQGQKN